MRPLLLLFRFCFGGLLIFTVNVFAVEKLPALGANIDNTSVSGLSSGAFMTSQLLMAHSAIMKGAGIVAGGPYLCAQSYPGSYLNNAITACMNPLIESVGPNIPVLIEKTRQLARDKKIDPIENVKKARLYLFSGANDRTVSRLVMNQTLAYYLDLGVPKSWIHYNKDTSAGHAFITTDQDDHPCEVTEPPFINYCDIPQAGRILAQIYQSFDREHRNQDATASAFDQSEFIQDSFTSMDQTAYVYIPSQCRQGVHCSIHVVFHGCLQGASVIGSQYYNGTGYNTYADANSLIMLYPQVHPSVKQTESEPYNPNGCWDFWGYSVPPKTSGELPGDYYSQSAPQIRAVYQMIKRLSSAPES